MQPEKRGSTLECKYCDAELRLLEPVSATYGDDGALEISRTYVCDKCGGGLTNYTPESGDCILEMPQEYKFALKRFLGRVALLFDLDDVIVQDGEDQHLPHSSMELWLGCSLLESRNDYRGPGDHGKHGDSISLQLCGCTRMSIHFDGHILYERWEERETPWDPERLVQFVKRAESFTDLSRKLDELLFESNQFDEIKELLAVHAAFERNRPFFCDGGEHLERLTLWEIASTTDYPERYFLDIVSGEDL